MQQTLAQVSLKSGEPMTVMKVTAPAPDWEERIVPLLQHKGDPWLWQVQRALAHGLPGATQHFFEGVLDDGTIVGNITTVEAHEPPIALLQHVFTPPEHRRKGICSFLMQAVCEDFRSRGGRIMFLHTGYDSAPYRIYESFGFVGHEQTGAMAWTLEKGFWDEYFRPGPTVVCDADWCDWVPLEALSWTVGGWQLRSFYLRKYGFGGFEGEFIHLAKERERGRVQQFAVLRTEAGVVAGWAILATLDQWPGAPLGLDLFVHPHFQRDAQYLAAAMRIPDQVPVIAWSEAGAEERHRAFERIGLSHWGTLSGLLGAPGGESRDVVIYGRPRR